MTTPFYSYPLEDFLKPRFRSIALSLRTLSDDQLQTETEELASLSHAARDQIPTRALLSLYRAETRRRKSPEAPLEDQLWGALSRLERATNDADRASVIEIGKRLHDLGGAAAIRRAYESMTTDCSKRSAELRAHILNKRWVGLLA